MQTLHINIILLITLAQAHGAAFAEEPAYRPAEYQPQTTYTEAEANTLTAGAVPETAAAQPASMPKAISTAEAKPAVGGPTPKSSVGGKTKSADRAAFAAAENQPPSDSNLPLLLMGVLAGAAVWFMRQKASRPDGGNAVTGETLETASAATGVERYLARQQANQKTGVEKYLAKQADSMPATGVSKYLAKQAANGKN